MKILCLLNNDIPVLVHSVPVYPVSDEFNQKKLHSVFNITRTATNCLFSFLVIHI